MALRFQLGHLDRLAVQLRFERQPCLHLIVDVVNLGLLGCLVLSLLVKEGLNALLSHLGRRLEHLHILVLLLPDRADRLDVGAGHLASELKAVLHLVLGVVNVIDLHTVVLATKDLQGLLVDLWNVGALVGRRCHLQLYLLLFLGCAGPRGVVVESWMAGVIVEMHEGWFLTLLDRTWRHAGVKSLSQTCSTTTFKLILLLLILGNDLVLKNPGFLLDLVDLGHGVQPVSRWCGILVLYQLCDLFVKFRYLFLDLNNLSCVGSSSPVR